MGSPRLVRRVFAAWPHSLPVCCPGRLSRLAPCERRMSMANKTVVLAIFNDEASADTAADALKKSGVAHHDAIGVLALNEKGEVKAHKVGKRSVGLGIGIGLVLALFSPIGLVVGLVGGGLL